MTDRLDEIRKRLEAATPRPWPLYPCSHGGAIVKRGREFAQALQIAPKEDAEFISNAPADIDYLLKEIERLRSRPNVKTRIVDREPFVIEEEP